MIICDICGDNMVAMFKIEGRENYRCRRCGLERICPQPSETELRCIYSDSYYEAWGVWQEDIVGTVKKETFKHRLNLIPSCRDAKVLDCGCATGYFLEVAKDHGFLPYGVEINEIAANITKKKFSQEQIYLGDIESCAFEEGSFYAIFMSDFLEHAANPFLTIKKAHCLLKPKGYLVITTPNTNSFSHKITKGYWPHYKTEHLFYFNTQNIGLILRKNGFELISINTAYKCLTLDYIKSQFLRYPRRGITSFLKGLANLLPRSLRFKKMWYHCGEMVVVALKS